MAINETLSIVLALVLVPLLVAGMIALAVSYTRRRHPKLPRPGYSDTQSTENWLKLNHTARPRSFTERIRGSLEALRLIKKPVVQEAYVMENGTKVST